MRGKKTHPNLRKLAQNIRDVLGEPEPKKYSTDF